MSEEGEKKLAPKRKMARGGRNLIWLGVISVAIAFVTTSVALIIYHNSGDIYLDRSRPGFLPEEGEEENENKPEEEYVFGKSGRLTAEDLEEYVENLEVEIRAVDSYEAPFNEKALSDQNLGITQKK